MIFRIKFGFYPSIFPRNVKKSTLNWENPFAIRLGNMIRGYYEIWVELNRSCRILDGLSPKLFHSDYGGSTNTECSKQYRNHIQ